MRAKHLVAGSAIVGAVTLSLVGVGANADASPPVPSNEPDPSSPTFTIEPAPSGPSPGISSDPGTTSSTDTGSGASGGPPSDPGLGGPSALPPLLDAPNGPPPSEAPIAPSTQPDPGVGPPPDLPPLPGDGPDAANAPGAAPSNPPPGDPTGSPTDLDHGCRPPWCPRPPNPPDPPGPPYWPWPDPNWPETSDTWGIATPLPSPCVTPPPQRDAPPPPPFQYGGQTVSPAFDGGLRQWGFWYLGNWVPLFGSECQTPAQPERAQP